MPEYLSPGVYVEEIDAGPKPIEGVSTSTAGAVGVTLFGPTTGKPELVTSFAEFVRKFGGFLPEPDQFTYNKWVLNPTDGGRYWHFPLAVKGFFDNGGQRLYVKRVISSSATAAASDFVRGLISEIVTDAAADATTLKVRHLIGISEGTPVAILTGAPPLPVDTNPFIVIKYDAAALSITLERPLGKLIKAGNSFVEIQPITIPATPNDRTLTIDAKDKGLSGNDVYVRVRPMSGSTLSVLPDQIAGGAPANTSVSSTKVTWVIEVDDITGLVEGNLITIKGHSGLVISNLKEPLKIFELEVGPPDLLNTDEATGGKQLVRIAESDSQKVATIKNITAPNTADVDNVTAKLTKADIISINSKEYVIESFTPNAAGTSGKIVLTTQLSADTAAGMDIKKLSLKILSAGTRDVIQIEDATGLAKDSKIVFVPTGKEFTLAGDPENNAFSIAPAIPIGKDWESKKIKFSVTTETKITEVATTSLQV